MTKSSSVAEPLARFWVIDHANSGRDILYRWGNPQAYGRGTASDQQLFGQHDPTWIPDGRPGASNMLIFNNGVNRPCRSLLICRRNRNPCRCARKTTPWPLARPSAHLPLFGTWTDSPPTNSYSAGISGCERMANGNTLITIGSDGHLIETDPAGNQVWSWDTPLDERVFKARRYERFPLARRRRYFHRDGRKRHLQPCGGQCSGQPKILDCGHSKRYFARDSSGKWVDGSSQLGFLF